jgi:hypothetical protein
MALRLPPSPAGIEQVVDKALQRAHGRGTLQGLAISASAASGGAAVTPAVPHEVFSLGLSDLVDGAGRLAAARPSAWRVIVLNGPNQTPLAAVEVADGASGNVPAGTFLSFNQGPFVKSTIDAIDAAEVSPQVNAADYELRLLEIPALHLTALWLQRPQRDLFVPLAPAPQALVANTIYTEIQLFDILSAMAKRRLTQVDEPQGTPPMPPP